MLVNGSHDDVGRLNNEAKRIAADHIIAKIKEVNPSNQ